MKTLTQSPTDPGFVQNPYPFYAKAQEQGQLHYWQDYSMVAAFGNTAVHMLLRDRRFGREMPEEMRKPGPAHLAPFLEAEAHSMLDAEPPRHTRLRKLVLHAFTSRGIAALEPGITALCHGLIDAFPDQPFDLLDAYCSQVPVITICRLLGVPEEMAPQLLDWSHRMVAMYQAARTEEMEHAAAQAAQAFSDFLRGYIEERRSDPRDDLITRLIAAEEEGDKLSADELTGTCILLLNAGHEASVHALGNGVKTLLQHGWDPAWLAPEAIEGLVEEILRFDPPLHLFTRYAYEEAEVFGHTFKRGDQVALLLGAANRDPKALDQPDRFNPARPPKVNKSFGGGLHFCAGAPLARLEMQIALQVLFARCPDLKLAAEPEYANCYHFHGLSELLVTRK
ncbi:cytochrome P450 [Leisingera sp. ANG-Vp]|uniref:cytochrome P450 n=1 Tax=Leisingera sp. ANG-Vp TaxID=1577896 RepID=UPI0005803396|nr:cytochrome P450 [Leisingera sp. ANG-Vp]KIC20986.1 cytochrome P450 [Leisingera sp. ANG-Vp]